MTELFQQHLWGLTKRGSFKWWRISVESDSTTDVRIVTQHAASEGAKIVNSMERITSGKNIGKANETTPITQAIFQARSKINKQLDNGYVLSKDQLAPEIGVLNTMRHPRPMLADSIKKLKDKDITGKMYVQPKLDGHRCLSTFDTTFPSNILMYSRAGKPITTMSHIVEDLVDKIPEGLYLDGELYLHGDEKLQDLTSLIKKEQEGSSTLQYWVYDTLDISGGEEFSTRMKRLQEFESPTIKIVPTYEVNSVEEALEYFGQWRTEGYEGAILRLDGGKYEAGFRSRSLLKIKEFQDAEFLVTKITQGKPRYLENGEVLQVAILHLSDPKFPLVHFTVTAPGDMYQKNEIFKNAANYLNKTLIVQYSMRTSDNVPFHPTALRWYSEI